MFFENTQIQLSQLYGYEIGALDTDIVEKDLQDFFERTELNPYAGDLRKVTRALKDSGLTIRKLKHIKNGAWNPIITRITYDVDAYGFGQKVFQYVWR